ncbi:MAG: DinB family protein [Acidobacteria bacterium]|nr:DinB family protein [Acidobacteriota bacterium]
MRTSRWTVLLALVSLTLLLAGAHPAAAQTAAAAPAAPTSGFRADFLADWDDLAKKAVSLAEAMPPEKYTWRPGEGVYSVSEIYLHIAGGNFGLAQTIGFAPPAGIETRGLMKSTTDKAKVLDILKQSFEHVRQAALKTTDADLDKPVKLFGQPSTVRNVFYILGTHQHEHFGLGIAYARVNGVVPPWTAARQAQQQLQKEKPKP